MLAALLVVTLHQASPVAEQDAGEKVLTVRQTLRDGYGADTLVVSAELQITATSARGLATRTRLRAGGKKPTSSAKVVTVPREIVAKLLQALAAAKPGKAVRPGTVVVRKSDTWRSVEVRVRDGDRELEVFSASTDLPPVWRLRTSPETTVEIADAQELDTAWRALEEKL